MFILILILKADGNFQEMCMWGIKSGFTLRKMTRKKEAGNAREVEGHVQSGEWLMGWGSEATRDEGSLS